jgi:hypothetical protein
VRPPGDEEREREGVGAAFIVRPKGIGWRSNAWPFRQGLLVTLHHRLFKAMSVLKLFDVQKPIMVQFQANQLVNYFNIYPNLESALKSDA